MISLVRGTAVERLGMVGGLKSETFVFPYRKLGAGTDVRLRAYPIGGPSAFTSENLLVQPGQWVKWTLESDLTQVVSGGVLGDGCHPEAKRRGPCSSMAPFTSFRVTRAPFYAFRSMHPAKFGLLLSSCGIGRLTSAP